MERLARYADDLREIDALGAHVLIPVQHGESMGQAEFMRAAESLLQISATPALPCKKAATTAAMVTEFCADYQPTTRVADTI